MTASRSSEYKTLLVEQKGPILEVVLNRPEARNAMSVELLGEFNRLLEEVEEDDSVGVLTLRGAGPSFSAGHDMKEVAQWFTSEVGLANMRAARRVPKMDRAWYFRKPLIAGVHGYVGPHALVLLSCFDFIIAADDTRFSFEQTRVGGGLPHSALAFQIPMRAYLKLTMMGGWFSAQTAREWDFVQRVVPVPEVDAETRRWAEEIVKVPAKQVQTMKDLIHRQYEDFGLLKILKAQSSTGGHGSPQDIRYFQEMVDNGLKSAVKLRDSGFDAAIAEI